MPECGFTRDGADFTGWKADSVTYQPGDPLYRPGLRRDRDRPVERRQPGRLGILIDEWEPRPSAAAPPLKLQEVPMSDIVISPPGQPEDREEAIVFSAILLALALLFPLIIWDALGSGAMHFMQYGHVSVAGSSAGDSKATFFFGLGYPLSHMGPGVFIPAQLFAAQWRGNGRHRASALAGGLGMVTMVLPRCSF